ncbi:disease resistance protein (TIR-NBS-LRR class) [Medicago truncatula]|uniref:Disease resistance protein (TIR-NBS-LRR class) n=1 Tax=Medicago truncatula TaxID=3880 RepID=A0A072U7K3_MEDTR|nr:disease resistance protein (TIR-NBS-LRR class) [Medicago truncatula]
MGKEKNSESSSSMPNLTSGTISPSLQQMDPHPQLFDPEPERDPDPEPDPELISEFLFKMLELKFLKDDNELHGGDHISKSLLRAIEESKISLIVFSKNYVNSRWCLDELKKIMKCYRTIGLKVVPVFYHLEPSKVRHQTGDFGKLFQSFLNKISNEEQLVQSWREALRHAANIKGFEILKSR